MIRFGVIGTNWITDSFIEAASHHPDFQLVAVYSRTEERAKEYARKHNAELTFTDLEEMANSSEIDAVYIASPNALHCEQSIIMMNGGKHVLCEKPLASNTKEIAKMIEAAKKNNVVLMEALKSTLMPAFKLIQQEIDTIGKVRRYYGNFCKYSSRYDAYRAGTVLNAFNPTLSNGSLMDLGVYCLYPLVVLFGEPKEIQANAVMLDSGVDGAGSIILQYDDFEAVINHSKISTSYVPSEIQGEEGSILIKEISEPEVIDVRYRNGDYKLFKNSGSKPSMYYEVEEFISLIKEGKKESAINSHQTSYIVGKIMEEARKQIGLIYPADEKF